MIFKIISGISLFFYGQLFSFFLASNLLVCKIVDVKLMLIQANSEDELPERLIGAVRASHIELSSAIVPELPDSPIE